MFERYTEAARRVIFFARYEASVHGSPYICPEHIFLGVVRETRISVAALFGGEEKLESIRARVSAAAAKPDKISTAADLPLDNGSKRVLAYAAEEAERAKEQWIDGGHLLLGLMREKPRTLQSLPEFASLDLEHARTEVARTAFEGESPARDNVPIVVVQRSLFWSGFAVGAISAIAIMFASIKGC
jgi:ATP-dependent Clp protease ATP-binding subunit ClpC